MCFTQAIYKIVLFVFCFCSLFFSLIYTYWSERCFSWSHTSCVCIERMDVYVYERKQCLSELLLTNTHATESDVEIKTFCIQHTSLRYSNISNKTWIQSLLRHLTVYTCSHFELKIILLLILIKRSGAIRSSY